MSPAWWVTTHSTFVNKGRNLRLLCPQCARSRYRSKSWSWPSQWHPHHSRRRPHHPPPLPRPSPSATPSPSLASATKPPASAANAPKLPSSPTSPTSYSAVHANSQAHSLEPHSEGITACTKNSKTSLVVNEHGVKWNGRTFPRLTLGNWHGPFGRNANKATDTGCRAGNPTRPR